MLFDTASHWIDRLALAHHASQLEVELKKVRRYKLIIIDEVGYILSPLGVCYAWTRLDLARGNKLELTALKFLWAAKGRRSG